MSCIYACKCYLCNLIDIPCKNLIHFHIMKIDLIISLIHEEKLGGGRYQVGILKILKNCSQMLLMMFLKGVPNSTTLFISYDCPKLLPLSLIKLYRWAKGKTLHLHIETSILASFQVYVFIYCGLSIKIDSLWINW